MPYTEERLEEFKEEIEKAYPEAYKWARTFHDLYEGSAPMFGYETRKETKEFDPKSPNGRLMAYVCFNLINQAVAAERERMRVRIENAIKYTDWSHSVGSHSDDRGGDSDIECTCKEVEARYKTEAYKNVLSSLTPTDTTK